MSLQKRLVAIVALLLVLGLLAADVVIYASVRSFLYGQADNTLAQNEAVGFNYLTFSAGRHPRVSAPGFSRRVSDAVYVTLLDRNGKVVLRRPSGSPTHPDPAPILTKSIPVQQVPEIYSRVRVGRYAGTFHPDPDAVVLGSKGDPDGAYRTVAVTVPQGTLVTSLSLNPTNDTLNSLRRVEFFASLTVLLAMGALVLVVVRRGLRPLRHMATTADAIASGDLTRRVPEGRPGTEIGQLGIGAQRDARPDRGRVRREVGVRGAASPVRGRRVARVAHPAHVHPRLRRAPGPGRLLRRGRPAQGLETDRGRGDSHGRPRRGPAAPGRAGPGPTTPGRASGPASRLRRRGR